MGNVSPLDEEHVAKAVAEAVERRLGVGSGRGAGHAATYLFGSFAKGTPRRGSDVDLAVLTSKRIDPVVLHELTQDVAVTIERDVRLLDLRSASTVMAATIVGEGRPIAMRDRFEAESFAARALSEYAHLNELRRPAMEAFLAPAGGTGPAESPVGGDVVVNRIAALERCLARIRGLVGDDAGRLDDLTIEEAVVLNLQRACEQAIGLAMHAAAARRLGLPQESREAFDLLEAAGVIDAEIADRMKRMVGFRDIAVHEYPRLDRAILKAIVTDRLDDFARFAAALVRA